MTDLERFDAAALPVSPWKNGGGRTREILRLPAGASLDDFLVRVSIAELAASGPFSAFPGVDRVIVLLDGAGIDMRAPDGSFHHRLDTPLEPFAFPGELAVDAAMLGAESRDFNVMTRRGRVVAETRVVRVAERIRAARAGVLFAVEGRWSAAANGVSFALTADTGVRWAGRELGWSVAPIDDRFGAARLLAVRVTDAEGRAPGF